MQLTFLGTGTSTGVPQIGCTCPVCTSADPRDKRLRASVRVVTDEGLNLLIDCGPDFRIQMLREGSPALEALLITHIHYDHVGGIDDLRPYCSHDHPFEVWCRADVAERLRINMPYSFTDHPYPGAPVYNLHIVDDDSSFVVKGQEIIPIPVMHGQLPILGYRIGSLGYVTDCSDMPEASLEKLKGVDTLVINALRHEPHPTHFTIEHALDVAARVDARATYLTHIAHQLGLTADVQPSLPPGVFLATDAATIEIRE